MEAAAKTASWKAAPPSASSKTIHAYLKEHARAESAGREGFCRRGQDLSATYTLAYIQHTPMEPRAAVAEWNDGKLTVWAGCDGPYRVKGDLARLFGIPAEQVRVIIPDMGGGFGGKHNPDAAAVEAARLAKAAGRPCRVRWTRAEEFTWAYFRPAAVIECRGGLDAKGSLVAWDFVNINAGGSAIDTPYNIPNKRMPVSRLRLAPAPGLVPVPGGDGQQLRPRVVHGRAGRGGRGRSAGVPARPSGEPAHPDRPGRRPRSNSTGPSAERRSRRNWAWGWPAARRRTPSSRRAPRSPSTARRARSRCNEVCEAFECGPILNPANLTSQVQGCIVMGLGGALFEEMQFENGKILNASFGGYRVPRFRDVPKIDVHLVNKTDIPSAGAGETPIIAIAPAVGNAVFAATGVRLRSMPMRGDMLKQA